MDTWTLEMEIKQAPERYETKRDDEGKLLQVYDRISGLTWIKIGEDEWASTE